ncbi:MAG: glycoside hydrolase family 17 [Gammaproteobacteria bacterium]|nr:glycoside hydrolase family 17 [Gammaproteobacteria bacterium]
MRPSLMFLPALATGTLAVALFWHWLGAPVALPEVPGGRLDCLSYTPFEPGSRTTSTPGWVSPGRIDADLRQLQAYTDCLRVYTPIGTTPGVVRVAEQLGMQVLLGAWIGSNLEQNGREVAAALELARQHPATVGAIVVGNEVLLRREMSPGRLAALIREVRSASPVPVAYADVAHFIDEAPEVANAADLLLIHILPYWDEPQPPAAAAAASQVMKVYDRFIAHWPGRKVMIGETGWPSAGRQRGPGRPTLLNEARFVREFAATAAARGIRYNLIEAIDQPWKRAAEGTVGGYWGLLDEYRRPKFALQGPVSSHPQWRSEAIATGSLFALLLAAGLAARLRAAGWLGWMAASLACAFALVLQWEAALVTARNIAGWIGAGLAATATLAAAGLLRGMLACGVRTAAPSASLAAAAAALGRPAVLLRDPSLRLGAFAGLVLVAASWISLMLAVEPRYTDIPVAAFALPALALAIRLAGRTGADQREAVLLAVLLLGCGLWQLEPQNPESLAWLAICLLLALPWGGALRQILVQRMPRP